MENEMEAFFTRAAGDRGITIPLIDPATGKESGHWVKIVSVDSTVFERADANARRRTGEIQKLDKEEEREQLVTEITRELIASLVIAWSFKTPCVRANVIEFLAQAPQIAKAVNQLAGQRSLFINGSSQASETSPEPTSSSIESSPEAPTPVEPT